jgi:transcriptional regulator with XRE-family HTH domain
MSQIEVAERVGIHPSHLYRIEAGSRPLGTKWRDKIARALGVSVDQLFQDIGQPITFGREKPLDFEWRAYAPSHEPHAVGERLAAVMKDTGLTPELLAPVIGATIPDVLDWLAGRILPPVRLMDRLANRVGLTLAWIYYGDASGLLPGVAKRLTALLPPEDWL